MCVTRIFELGYQKLLQRFLGAERWRVQSMVVGKIYALWDSSAARGGGAGWRRNASISAQE